MTRTEFDNQVRALKAKRDEALRPVRNFQQVLKEQMRQKSRIVQDQLADIAKIKHHLHLLGVEHEKINDEWGGKIRTFIEEYESHTTSNLAEADTLNIIYELRNRGIIGIVHDTIHGCDYDLDKHDWK